MYKILLADNEGVVLDSLIHIIHSRFNDDCDIRVAKTSLYTRALARKFIPDIAIINIQMPGMRGLEVVREIRSYHLKCIFITVSASDRAAYHTDAKNLNILAHLTKPLFREKILPVLENAVSIVAHSQKRMQQNRMIQEKFDAAVPVVEHGLINQLFFPDSYVKSLKPYTTLLGISQNYGRIITLTFGELPQDVTFSPEQTDVMLQKKDALQNPAGSAVHLQKDYMKFRETVLESFPQAVIGPVMGNHVLLLVPCWKEAESAKETAVLLRTCTALTETLEDVFDGLSFCIESGPVKRLEALCFPE